MQQHQKQQQQQPDGGVQAATPGEYK